MTSLTVLVLCALGYFSDFMNEVFFLLAHFSHSENLVMFCLDMSHFEISCLFIYFVTFSFCCFSYTGHLWYIS